MGLCRLSSGSSGRVEAGEGGRIPAGPRAERIKYDKAARIMQVDFACGASFSYPAELLRVESPGADNQALLGRGKVGIMAIEPVGRYAVRLLFDDLHSTGIFSWGFLYELGQDQEGRMQRYLERLEKAGLSRHPERPQRGPGGGAGAQPE